MLDRAVFEAGLRAPSPHSSQPWRFRINTDAAYDFLYRHEDKQLCDPDDRAAWATGWLNSANTDAKCAGGCSSRSDMSRSCWAQACPLQRRRKGALGTTLLDGRD